MSARIWTGFFADGLSSLVEYTYVFGRDLDQDLRDPETLHVVTVAEAVSRVLGDYGEDLPVEDRKLLARLRRDQEPAPAGEWWSIAVTADENLGVVTPNGVIESCGPALAVVESPEDDRYIGHYYAPGVWYLGAGGGVSARD